MDIKGANEEEKRYGRKRKTLLFLLRYTLYLIRVKKNKILSFIT